MDPRLVTLRSLYGSPPAGYICDVPCSQASILETAPGKRPDCASQGSADCKCLHLQDRWPLSTGTGSATAALAHPEHFLRTTQLLCADCPC